MFYETEIEVEYLDQIPDQYQLSNGEYLDFFKIESFSLSHNSDNPSLNLRFKYSEMTSEYWGEEAINIYGWLLSHCACDYQISLISGVFQ